MLKPSLAMTCAALAFGLAWSVDGIGAERAGKSENAGGRLPWTGSRITGRPEPPPPFVIERIHSGAEFKSTTLIDHQPLLGRLFVGGQSGKIFALPRDRSAGDTAFFFDAADSVERLNRGRSADERVVFAALYGMAFDPEFATNRLCYVCYVVKRQGFAGKPGRGGEQLPHGTRVMRLRVGQTEPPACDPASEQLVIS